MFKGTVSVICDLPFIEWHVWFTTIPFKPLLSQGLRRYSRNRASVHYNLEQWALNLQLCRWGRGGRQGLNCKNAWEVGKDFLQVLHLICDTCTKSWHSYQSWLLCHMLTLVPKLTVIPNLDTCTKCNYKIHPPLLMLLIESGVQSNQLYNMKTIYPHLSRLIFALPPLPTNEGIHFIVVQIEF